MMIHREGRRRGCWENRVGEVTGREIYRERFRERERVLMAGGGGRMKEMRTEVETMVSLCCS